MTEIQCMRIMPIFSTVMLSFIKLLYNCDIPFLKLSYNFGIWYRDLGICVKYVVSGPKTSI
jgi:hypothetical protein